MSNSVTYMYVLVDTHIPPTIMEARIRLYIVQYMAIIRNFKSIIILFAMYTTVVYGITPIRW